MAISMHRIGNEETFTDLFHTCGYQLTRHDPTDDRLVFILDPTDCPIDGKPNGPYENMVGMFPNWRGGAFDTFNSFRYTRPFDFIESMIGFIMNAAGEWLTGQSVDDEIKNFISARLLRPAVIAYLVTDGWIIET